MTPDEKIKWYRSPIAKDALLELTRRNNLKGFIHITAFLIMSVLTGALSFYVFYNGPIWMFILAIFVHCTLFQFYGRVAASHELCHRTVFESKTLNDVFAAVFTFLAWENCVFYRARHTRHHQYTAYNDQDAELFLPIIITSLNWFHFCTVDFYKFFDAVKINALFGCGIVKGRMNEILFPDKKSRDKLSRQARILLFGHIFLAAVFIYFKLWPMLLIVSLAPFMCQWLNLLVAFPQHAGMQPEVTDFRRCCRTNELGPVLSFLYFNMQYHTEHHMYAAVPFYNLPKLRKAIEHDLPKTSGGLIATWKEMRVAMKKQKADPNYYLPVELPGL